MSLNAVCIISWKVMRAFVNPKGITVYLNSLFFVQKAVFHSWPVAIRIRLYPFFKLSLKNHLPPLVLSNTSKISSREYLFDIVSRFKA